MGLSSCDEDESAPAGTIEGFAFAQAEYLLFFTVPVSENPENISVSLLLYGDTITVNTQRDGSFAFENVPAGTYDLVFKKEGLGMTKVNGVQVIPGAGPTYVKAVVTQRSETRISNLSFSVADDGSMFYIGGNVTYRPYDVSPLYGNAAVVFGLTADVSMEKHLKMELIRMTPQDLRSGFISRPIGVLPGEFPPGSIVYCRAYGVAWADQGTFSFETPGLVYYSFSEPSEVESITMP